MKKLLTTMMLSASLMSLHTTTEACTDFRLQAKDGTVIITRSMEFAVDTYSNVRNSNRGREFTSTTPDGKPGLTWKGKYGYLYVDGMNQDFAIDGMNEKGLSFEYLYLPGETTYQTIPAGKESQGVPYMRLGDWVLSNFSTIAEVRAALASIYVYKFTMPELKNVVFPLHAAIFDATGKGIVVEFVNGQMVISDHIGVMTNSPTYEWQVTNLRNYLNLSPINPKPVVIDGMTYGATGQGAGMVGLPGDISPPSRFVKTAFLLQVAVPGKDTADTLNLAQHIIDNVDIPAGLTRSVSNGQTQMETTEWVVFKDLTHKVFYYRTYGDLTVRKIDMSKLNFDVNAPKFKMPLADKAALIVDETDRFMKS